MNPPIVFIPHIQHLYDSKTYIPISQNIVKKLSTDLVLGKQIWVKSSEDWTRIYSENWIFPQWLTKRIHTIENDNEVTDLIKNYSTTDLNNCVTISSQESDFKLGIGRLISPATYFPEKYPSVDELYATGAQVILYYGKSTELLVANRTYINIKDLPYSKLTGRRFLIHVTDNPSYRSLIDSMVVYFPNMSFLVVTDGSHPLELEQYAAIIYWKPN